MYYGEIKKHDIANGEGVRVSLFVSGCRNHCPGCFNQDTWDFTYGSPFTEETQEELLAALAPSWISGLTLLGGDPFEPENQVELGPFLRKVREKFPQKDIWCYTGYRLEEELFNESRVRTSCTDAMLAMVDVLVDGRFHEKEKDITLLFRGSVNQRIIDMRKSRETGEIVLWEPKIKRGM